MTSEQDLTGRVRAALERAWEDGFAHGFGDGTQAVNRPTDGDAEELIADIDDSMVERLLQSDERIETVERTVVDLSYELYLLSYAVQSICGTDITKKMGRFYQDTASRLNVVTLEEEARREDD